MLYVALQKKDFYTVNDSNVKWNVQTIKKEALEGFHLNILYLPSE